MLSITLLGKEFNPVQIVTLFCCVIGLVKILQLFLPNFIDPVDAGPASIAVGGFLLLSIPLVVIYGVMAYGMWVNSTWWAFGWIFYGSVFMFTAVNWTWTYLFPRPEDPNATLLPALLVFALICGAYIWNFVHVYNASRNRTGA